MGAVCAFRRGRERGVLREAWVDRGDDLGSDYGAFGGEFAAQMDKGGLVRRDMKKGIETERDISPQDSNYSSRIMLIGIILTAVVVAIFYYAHWYWNVCEFPNVCLTKWEYLKASPPNEMGDTLAGFAGTLAFIWLVATVLLQAHELKEQRYELANTTKALETQSSALDRQTSLLEAENKRHLNLELSIELDSYLIDLCRVCELIFKTETMSFEITETQVSGMTDEQVKKLSYEGNMNFKFFGDFSTSQLDERVYSHGETLMLAHIVLFSYKPLHGSVSPSTLNLLNEVDDRLNKVFSIIGKLPRYEIARLNSLKWDKFKESVQAIVLMDFGARGYP